MDIMTSLAAIAQAMNIAKGLHEIEKGFDAAEFKLKIAELYSALAEAQRALADAKTEIEAKQAELNALTAQFQVRADAIEYKGFKYAKGADGSPVGWPYCPKCETQGQMVTMTYSGERRGAAVCPHCEAVYRYVEKFPYPSK